MLEIAETLAPPYVQSDEVGRNRPDISVSGHQGLYLFDSRNVFRVAIAYLVATWLVLQVADIVLEIIAAPDWVAQVFLLIAALGFPIVLIFSWAYELTPEGLKREEDVDRSRSITSATGRKLDMITIGMLVAVLVFVGLERMMFSQLEHEVPVAGTQADRNSIAVLAFEDLSPDGDQAYFVDGLSEELLNVLAQVADLKVAGRTSSFAFRGQNKDLREIGEILNVAHILEGSVRKSGDRIRVTAQLVKASDGFHLFSETYDRELSDIFAVQDEISQSISSALLSEIIGTETVGKATPTDPEAYELYLLARQRIHSRDPMRMNEALNMLGRALEIDPAYAPAVAQKALATYLLSDSLGAYGDTPESDAVPAALKLVDQALALDDGLAEAHAIKGLLLDSQAYTPDEVIAMLRHALELNPNLSDAANWLANAYNVSNRREEARAIQEEIVARDPMYGPAFNNLTSEYVRTGDYDRADALISRVERIVGENNETLQSRGMVSVMRGEVAKAVRDLRRVHAENPNATIVQLWYGFALGSIADYETLVEVGLPEHRMLAYASQGDIDSARRVLYELNVHTGFPQRVLSNVGYVLNADDSSQEFIDYVNEQYGSLDNLLQTYPVSNAWGTGYLGDLAYAYLQVDDEATFRMLLDEMHRALDVQGSEGTNNWIRHYSQAQYAALNGDVEGALVSIQATFDNGYAFAGGFDNVVFSGLRGEPRFEEIAQTLAQRVDDERSKLGMPPYRPFPADRDRKRRTRGH
jgi:TolB-like protein/tetratricopeptide (TPR) repeat protein